MFIEVKRSGENLENHRQQLLEYCFQEGVKLAALTNGRTWWLRHDGGLQKLVAGVGLEPRTFGL